MMTAPEWRGSPGDSKEDHVPLGLRAARQEWEGRLLGRQPWLGGFQVGREGQQAGAWALWGGALEL